MGSRAITAIAAVLALAAGKAQAQNDPEYRMEIGAGIGLTAYQGDFSSSLTKEMQPAWIIMGKYRFDPRAALTFTIMSGKIKGSSANVRTWYPEISEAAEPLTFKSTLTDACLTFEYNFWAYGTGREYRGARPLAPYLSAGLGAVFASTPSGSTATACLPLGVGVKYKVAERVNMALAWTMHFSMSDKLDGTVDPYGIKSSGIFKNTDCYSTLSLTLSYDIWAKCRTCHNEYE